MIAILELALDSAERGLVIFLRGAITELNLAVNPENRRRRAENLEHMKKMMIDRVIKMFNEAIEAELRQPLAQEDHETKPTRKKA